ncbi:MAG: hypothetical protein M1839_003290 [Geoglossum umbratile]|nr:MAG: hypothetical protein M1839_003290 [Geoglossum umbratile]
MTDLRSAFNDLFTLSTIVLAVAIAALAAAWYTGALDRPYVQLVEQYFRAKARTQAAGLRALGQREGVDFVAGQFDASKKAKQAQETLEGLDGGAGVVGEEVGRGVRGVTGGVGKGVEGVGNGVGVVTGKVGGLL